MQTFLYIFVYETLMPLYVSIYKHINIITLQFYFRKLEKELLRKVKVVHILVWLILKCTCLFIFRETVSILPIVNIRSAVLKSSI